MRRFWQQQQIFAQSDAVKIMKRYYESWGDFDSNNKFLYSLMMPKSWGDCINYKVILTAQKP